MVISKVAQPDGHASGGTITTGVGYIACGGKNGFNTSSGRTSLVYQDVTVAPGTSLTFSGFAGTHTPGLSCSPKLSLIFRNAAGTVLSQKDITVTHNVDINFGQLAYYSITAVAPTGTAKVRIQSSINCNYMKLDAFCLKATGTNALSRTANTGESKKEIAMQPEFSVSVSPNPAKTFFNLSVNSSDKINPVEVRILGIDGETTVRAKDKCKQYIEDQSRNMEQWIVLLRSYSG